MTNNSNKSQTGQQRTFRCADAGFKECKWQAVGSDDNEIMDQVKEHGQKVHGITNFDENMRRKVQDNIHDRQAA